ncbi:unnamed protein product [Arctogadus glacialis]
MGHRSYSVHLAGDRGEPQENRRRTRGEPEERSRAPSADSHSVRTQRGVRLVHRITEHIREGSERSLKYAFLQMIGLWRLLVMESPGDEGW